jgi:putative ABC transport system permease protein
MSLFHLVLKSLRQHALSTWVTALSIALAGGLLMSVWVVKTQSSQTFTNITGGFDAVLGARGSKLQLVLNAIYHLEASPGNLAWQDYLDIKARPAVQHAIPLAVGDNYRGYRIVGTQTNLFTDIEVEPGRKLVPAAGRVFNAGYREATLGSFAAQRLRLKVGDTFQPYHGLIFNPADQHEETYVVVGVLEPSNSPMDRVIWIPLEGVQNMAGHDPKTATDISAVLVKLRTPVAGQQLETLYNRQGNRLTLAWPIGLIMAQLFDKIGWFDRVLAIVAYLVAAVATGSILASIYNSMNERRRDFAILRALGARRFTVFATIILESTVIAALGMVIAFAIYLAIMSGAANIIRAQTGVVLNPFAWHPVMLWAPLGMIAAAALAGVVPAFKAYRTDVASNLTPVS